MADISKLNVNSTNYNIKDASAISSLSVDGRTVTYTKRDGTTGTIKTSENFYPITEDIVTVTTDATKGVAPYSTSYGYTNIEISKDAGIEWVEGGMYAFDVNTKMVVASANRNVRVRIGGANDGDSWHPVMGYSSSILAGSTYLVKAMTCFFQYKTVYQSVGALHLNYDANSTYAYLVNTVPTGSVKIASNGYGARYSLIFPTTAIGNADERYSSLVTSSSSGTTKAKSAVSKFYIDRHPQYIYSANISANTASANATYQNYTGTDIRYTVNTSETYVSVNKKLYLWLKNFDATNMSFEADATVGNIMSEDKIATRFPSTTAGDVYLYFLGWNSSTWYSLTPNFEDDVIIKYTPSTGAFTNAMPLFSTEHKAKLDGILDLIYPVGSIYMSANNVSPQTFIGGTWERIKDRFLLSAGDTYTAGNTGGSAKHTITTSEMPSHTHSVNITTDSQGSHTHKLKDWGNTASGTTAVNVGGNSVGSASTYSTESAGAHTHTVSGNTGSTGSGTAMNIMNPYLVVYVWKRTA